MKPHKYADVIKAWADGSFVQYRISSGSEWTDWYFDAEKEAPSFRTLLEWRVKPQPVKLMYRVALMKNRQGFFACTVDSMDEAAKIFGDEEFVRWVSEWEMVEA